MYRLVIRIENGHADHQFEKIEVIRICSSKEVGRMVVNSPTVCGNRSYVTLPTSLILGEALLFVKSIHQRISHQNIGHMNVKVGFKVDRKYFIIFLMIP